MVFSLIETGYSLDLKFTLFGDWVFNAWEKCFQNVREHYDCSAFFDLQKGFAVFLGGSA